MATHIHSQSLLERLAARDRELYMRWVALDASTISRRFWRTVTHCGSAVVTIAVVIVMLCADDPAVHAAGIDAGIALAATHVVAQILKRTISRPRPHDMPFDALIAMPQCFSFPSGHTIAANSMVFALSAHFPAAAPALLPLGVLVGVSRVRVGVHYPGDVLAGYVIALGGAVATALL